jgi:hypothetical protein
MTDYEHQPEHPDRSIKIVDYDKTTGQINRVVTYYEAEHAGELYPGCLYLPVETETNDMLFYVKDSSVLPRPVSTVYLDGAKLCNVRENAAVIIDGETYTADGSEITLEFSHSGQYLITVKDWPFLDWSGIYEN